MNVEILKISDAQYKSWDIYVGQNTKANPYHSLKWQRIINNTYGHTPYYLVATRNGRSMDIVGILPLFHMKNLLFGNKLVSTPFFDHGGILADDLEAEKALFDKAFKLGKKLGVREIELRHLEPISWLASDCNAINQERSQDRTSSFIQREYNSHRKDEKTSIVQTDKVRMVLELPDNSDTLLKSFKSKLRSQIKRPFKEGLRATIGGDKLIDDFYHVFSENMRDLGSPVHKKELINNVLKEFQSQARIIIVYKNKTPIACSLVFGFKDTLANPWASALRKYKNLSSNMFLYWTMLSYACEKGYRYFDFGRSSYGEGTYRFKAQWGAKEHQMHWHHIFLNRPPHGQEAKSKDKYSKAISIWRNLPIPIANIIGPRIRKHIAL